jgi:hypothetical protein
MVCNESEFTGNVLIPDPGAKDTFCASAGAISGPFGNLCHAAVFDCVAVVLIVSVRLEPLSR